MLKIFYFLKELEKEELEKEELEKVGNAALEELEKELDLENSRVEIKHAIINFKVEQASLDTRTRPMMQFNHSGEEANIKINIFYY